MVKEMANVGGWHTLYDRIYHQKESVSFQSTILRIFQLKLPEHAFIDQEKRPNRRKSREGFSNISDILFVEVISVEDSNIKDLSLVFSSQSYFNAINFPFSKVDILNTKLMFPHFKPAIYFLNGILEVNILIDNRHQTYINI